VASEMAEVAGFFFYPKIMKHFLLLPEGRSVRRSKNSNCKSNINELTQFLLHVTIIPEEKENAAKIRFLRSETIII
jgi:hypothetical protein